MKFTDFSFNRGLEEGIDAIGFEEATPIQEKAIPLILDGEDIIGSAQTGTGKTAAFLFPIIHKIISSKQSKHISALIIVPTRELAIQIDQQMQGFAYFTSISSIAVYGGGDGSSFANEKQALSQGADVVIATPGRLISHLNLGYVKVEKVEYFVLDEADRMLDMGFYDDIIKIKSYLPVQRQNLMFAATMPQKIRELALKVLNNPKEINIAISKPAEKILQLAYVVYNNQKLDLAKFILSDKNIKSAIVFCSTKSSTKTLSMELKKNNLAADNIQSDLEQKEREQVLNDFKSHKINILVATDIVSRGIDIDNIDMVINYDVPNEGEDYIHRIGRTARAEADGVAITFINEKEQTNFLEIENLLGSPVHKVVLPPQFGDTPEYNPVKSKHKTRYNKRKPNNYKKKSNYRRK
ncbi:MAG: DEAD/DEAH box helicase [Bacteroidota bacterium]|nr:DEAD/DEAH box helicase [Bacteroidota bacterium]